MPELPDVEVHCRNLSRSVSGKEVSRIVVRRPNRVHCAAADLNSLLAGARIESVQRQGKSAVIGFDNEHVLAVHFMLQGGFELLEAGEPPRHATIAIQLDNDKMLCVADVQGWSTVDLDPETGGAPDALGAAFDLGYFQRMVEAHPRFPVKSLLTDQNVVAGIGNAYSDEILWHARVDPAKPCRALTVEQVREIHAQTRAVLEGAIAAIDRDHPGMISGEPRDHMAVHSEERKCSPTGHPILLKQVGGKRTFYTEEQI